MYYYKDHLGSVRAVVNGSNELVSAQDYDAWGYLLQGRGYESDQSKFKFTEKERDVESNYDYFGARYYDSRIGRWGGVDVKSNLQLNQSPYNYCINNPLAFTDFRGEKIYWSIGKEYSEQALDELMQVTGLDLSIDENGFLYLLTENVYGGSETARNKILDILNSTEVLNVYSDLARSSFGEVGGTIVNLNPSQMQDFIGGVHGGLSALEKGWGISLLHEIYHTQFGFSIGHEEMGFGEVGRVETQANLIRQELGLPQQMSYGPLKINDEFNVSIRLIPFDKESLDLMNSWIANPKNVNLKDLKGKYIKY